MSLLRQVAFLLIVVAAVGYLPHVAAIAEPAGNPEPTPKQPPSLLSTSFPRAVECYSCVNCPTVTNKTAKQFCPYHPDPLKFRKCVKYSENYPSTKTHPAYSWVIRGCATERGSCNEIQKAYDKTAVGSPPVDQLEYCVECEGDKCNGVSRSDLNTMFAFFAVVVTPILARYTLS